MKNDREQGTGNRQQEKLPGGRITIRNPQEIQNFSGRFRVMLAELNISQREMAKILGGFRNDTLSRITRELAASIPIDLIVALANYADANGVSIKWLLTGKGERNVLHENYYESDSFKS